MFLHSSSAKHAVVLKTYNSLNRLAGQDLLIPEISQKYFLSLVMKVKCRKLTVCAHIRKGIIFLLVVFIIFLMLHGSIFHETMKGIKEMSLKLCACIGIRNLISIAACLACGDNVIMERG